jgi:alpha-tubulin suppressor-like RCC1 family protein
MQSALPTTGGGELVRQEAIKEEERDVESIEKALKILEDGLQEPADGEASFGSIQSLLDQLKTRLAEASSTLHGDDLRVRIQNMSDRLQQAQLAHSARCPPNALPTRLFKRTMSEVVMQDVSTPRSETLARRVSLDNLISNEEWNQAGGLLRSKAGADHGGEKGSGNTEEGGEMDVSDAASSFSCMDSESVSGSGSIYSWGAGALGALLHNDTNDRDPGEGSLVAELRKAIVIASISTNTYHTACATSSGEVIACGSNDEGAVDPSRVTLATSVEAIETIIVRPVLLESLSSHRIIQVSCGLHHTAALSASGAVIAWGSNESGQLGHRHSQSRFVEPKAMLLGGHRAASIACGHYFTLILTTRMEVLVCGVGELAGTAAPVGRDIDRPSIIPALEGLPIALVVAGNAHALVLTTQGTAFAWGANPGGCCGLSALDLVATPTPMRMPTTLCRPTNTGPHPFPNWAVWGHIQQRVALADDVACVAAACGGQHTVLITKSGRLLVCGKNQRGQLGFDPKVASICPVAPLSPPSSRRFVSVAAGDSHTLLLDDNGDVYQMGTTDNNESSVSTSGPTCVLSGAGVQMVAAGGHQSFAVAAASSGLVRLFSVMSSQNNVRASAHIQMLLEQLRLEDEVEAELGGDTGRELIQKTDELLRWPAVLNSLAMDAEELEGLYQQLILVQPLTLRRAICSTIASGIKSGLEKFKPSRHPESVRCLLYYWQFPLFSSTAYGELFLSLCRTTLDLPFEGHKALLKWVTSSYPKHLFVSRLVRPLQAHLAEKLREDRRSGHTLQIYAIILKWLYNASEAVGIPYSDFYVTEGISNLPAESLYEDLVRWRNANASERSLTFFLCGYSFLITARAKKNLFQVEASVEMTKAAHGAGLTFDPQRGLVFNPYLVIIVDRQSLLQQTLQQIATVPPAALRKQLKIIFMGEEGVDEGGVRKEYFQLLVSQLFDINTGMWTQMGRRLYWFNGDCTWNDDGYGLVGVLIGLAVYNSTLLDVHFPTAVYRKLLKLPIGLEDVVDDDLRSGLRKLLDYDGEDVEDVFSLCFEVEWMDLGFKRNVELKPGGGNIPVTSSNKEEYVRLYVQWLLVDSVDTQYRLFEDGFHRVMHSSASLELLRPEELELLVVGTPSLDFNALQVRTEYEGYDKDSKVVRDFWRFVHEGSFDTQVKLLKFCTGSSRAPIGGLSELDFKIQRAGPDSMQLPTSHTCFNTIMLPEYSNYEKLKDRLGRAIVECEGFGLK